MRVLLFGSFLLMLALDAAPARAQAPAITLGRPQPLFADPAPALIQAPAAYRPPTLLQTSYAAPAATLSTPRPIFRGQSPDFPPIPVSPPPPPPPPGAAPGPGGLSGPAVFPGGPAPAGIPNDQEAYNCGLVTSNADQEGFWARCGDRFKRGWTDVTGAVSGGVAGIAGRTMFQSDHEFDYFISPVTNPVFFEDPRALTEFRPSFIWQNTRAETPFFAGGNNYFLNLQGRVAFTPCFSLVINKLGWTWINPEAPVPGVVEEGNGFSELHLGPKYTFLRSEVSGTVAAFGLNFEIAAGSNRVLQNTGNLSLSPYFSIAQRLYRTPWGTFNFMNTTGYSLGIDSERTDFFYLSGHLDFDILDQHKIYPLVELNWTRYTFNGSARSFGFEGNNLFNFGSDGTAGKDDLTLAVGGRFKYNECVQFGLAAEFSVLGGYRHMDDFRLTMDVIFRY